MGDDGRAFGVALGVGAVVGTVFLLLRPRKAAAATLGSPREMPFPSGSTRTPRFSALVERWRGEVERRAKDLPVNAILEWIRIESGGDMCAIGNPNEVGIFQLYFPGDAKYGATLEGLRKICARSKQQNPADISWLSEADLDMQVGAGIRKILAAREDVRKVFAQNGVRWSETSFDFGAAVKQIHATPAVITELVPKITRRNGPPASWVELRRRVMSFPVDQMGKKLQALWNTPSKHGLQNRLEDTLHNAEFVGRVWGASPPLVAGMAGTRGDTRGRHLPWIV